VHFKKKKMSVDDFTLDKQTNFKQALANAASVALSKVKIAKIASVSARRSRRLLAKSIRIDVQIAVQDDSAAQAAAGNLTPANIISQLSKAGIPGATVLFVQLPAPKSNNSAIIAGATLGGIAAVVLIGCATCLTFARRRRRTVNLDLRDALLPGSENEGRLGSNNMHLEEDLEATAGLQRASSGSRTPPANVSRTPDDVERFLPLLCHLSILTIVFLLFVFQSLSQLFVLLTRVHSMRPSVWEQNPCVDSRSIFRTSKKHGS